MSRNRPLPPAGRLLKNSHRLESLCHAGVFQQPSTVMLAATIVLALLLSAPAFPGGAAFWQMDTYNDFARGSFTGISLSRDGKLSLAPHLEEIFATGQALVWTLAQDSAGNLYMGTGHSGKVFRLNLDQNSKAEEFFDAPESDIFALAVDRQNNLYVGTSPDGKVYKVTPGGRSQEFFNPQAKYIWSLAVDSDGAIFVGTGGRGRIYRVAPDGTGSLFFETHQTHVMSLAVAPDQALVAGSEPNGLLYRISRAGRGFVLYDSPLAEIHSVAVAPDGSVFASAMAAGGPRGRGPWGGAGDVVISSDSSVAPMTINVQAAPPIDPEKDKLKEKPGDAEKAAAEKAARDAAAASLPAPAVDYSGGLRSAIYRVAPDRTVETVWSSREESVFDILPAAAVADPGRGSHDAAGLLFSTDERGRVYQLGADKQTTLLVQTNEEQTTRLLRRGPHVLAATSNLGKLFRLGTLPAERGWYESPVKDTRSISRWGKLSWRGPTPAGARIEFFTRGGNSATPDPTWSDWEPARDVALVGGRSDLFDAQISSPPARYLQWKAVFQSSARAPGRGSSATLEEVAIAYLPQNRAPIIQSVTVNPAPYAAAPSGARPTPGGTAVAGVDPMVVVVDGDSGTVKTGAPLVVTGSSGGAGGVRAGGAAATITIAWSVEDPDGDRLTFSLYLRGEGESDWKLLKDNLRDSSFQPEPETLPDGKYQVRLIASDAEANPAQSARAAEMASAPFLVDNTPPVVRLLKQERKGPAADPERKLRVEVRFEVADAASVIRRAEYSVDGGAWLPVYSDDGIVDSRTEVFTLPLELAPGEHVVVLRAYDSGGNAGMGKAILK